MCNTVQFFLTTAFGTALFQGLSLEIGDCCYVTYFHCQIGLLLPRRYFLVLIGLLFSFSIFDLPVDQSQQILLVTPQLPLVGELRLPSAG